jgi:hypothetical protein
MAKKNSEARSGSPKRNEQKAARIDVDFEDLLGAAIASVIIKRQKNASFPPDASRKFSSSEFESLLKAVATQVIWWSRLRFPAAVYIRIRMAALCGS